MNQDDYDAVPSFDDDELALERAQGYIALLLEQRDLYSLQNYVVECGIFGDARGRQFASWLDEICPDTCLKEDYSNPLNAAVLADTYIQWLLEVKDD